MLFFSGIFSLRAEEEEEISIDREKLKKEWVKKVRNPFERERKDIEKLEKKRAGMPPGDKRDKLDEKIIAAEKALELKKEKIAVKIGKQMERLEKQLEKQQDESKRNDILRSVKELKASLILLDCWAAGEDPGDRLAELEQSMPAPDKNKEKKTFGKKSGKAEERSADAEEDEEDAGSSDAGKNGKKQKKTKKSKKEKKEEDEE